MANIQKKVQPFQIEQHKLDVGSIRGYIPSDENASKTLVVRNDNCNCCFYASGLSADSQ